MDLWRDRGWRAAVAGGRGRRTGVRALGLLGAAAGSSVLLAWQFHLGVPAIAIGILGGLPGLYLAWAAVRDDAREGSGGVSLLARPVGRWDPVELGVHRVIGGGLLPPYVHRRHDEVLRAVLDPRVAANRLVVVRGGSSTGKSRAAYEAVLDRLAGWRLDYPLTAAALAERLDAGVEPRTVLWLGELRQYAADADGAKALAGLADLLGRDNGVVAITTLWPEHWRAYLEAGPLGVAGRLLDRLPDLGNLEPEAIEPRRGGVIDIPDRFTADELAEADRSGDQILAQAVAAARGAGSHGRVAQYLAGVPELLARYDGRGGDPYGQALIAVAMDAVRLGHADLLPARLLRDAVTGYLTGQQRAAAISTWWEPALAYATRELMGAVRALEPVPPVGGTGVAGYQIADYLDQHGRRARLDVLGPASLWEALAASMESPEELCRVGDAAVDRGLYRHAAILWTRGIIKGSQDSARRLIRLLDQFDPDGARHAGVFAARNIALDDPYGIARLLRALKGGGAADAVAALLDRDPAAHVAIHDADRVAGLLGVLREAGAGDSVALLADRAARGTDLGNPRAIASLMEALHRVGTADAAAVLAGRVAAEADVGDPYAIVGLLTALRGAKGAVAFLADRAARCTCLDNPSGVAWLLDALTEVRAKDAVTVLLARDPAAHVALDDPSGVARLLQALRAAGAGSALAALAGRAAQDVRLNDPHAIAQLIRALSEVGSTDAVTALLDRNPAAHVAFDDPYGMAFLLRVLDEAGETNAADVLAQRAVAGSGIDEPARVAGLLDCLAEGGAGNAAAVLAGQAARDARLDDPAAAARLLRAVRDTGTPAATAVLADRASRDSSLNDPAGVAGLLRALSDVGATDAMAVVFTRSPAAHAQLDHPSGVARLLKALREIGADDAIADLPGKAAAAVQLDDTLGTADLLRELREADAADAIAVLAGRAANAGMFALYLETDVRHAQLYTFGREPTGAPSSPWKWAAPGDQAAN